jgi:hypothetical protein
VRRYEFRQRSLTDSTKYCGVHAGTGTHAGTHTGTGARVSRPGLANESGGDQ